MFLYSTIYAIMFINTWTKKMTVMENLICNTGSQHVCNQDVFFERKRNPQNSMTNDPAKVWPFGIIPFLIDSRLCKCMYLPV